MMDQPGSQNAVTFAQSTIKGFTKKANHNKNESLRCFVIVVSCSLLSPLFVTLGSGMLLGKVVPSALSLLAAGSTAWLQLRKPQSLWTLYRDCQRRLEDHLTVEFHADLTHHFHRMLTHPIQSHAGSGCG